MIEPSNPEKIQPQTELTARGRCKFGIMRAASILVNLNLIAINYLQRAGLPNGASLSF
jgi:hypothetical protein